MNCKILIIGLVALCCLQLALAREEDEPVQRRSRSRRITRSPPSSKSLKRSKTEKLASSEVDSSTASSNTKNPAANISKDLPTTANQTVLVEGKDGSIFVNKEKKYPFRDEVSIKVRDGNIYVNDNLVLKKPLKTNGSVAYMTHNLSYQEITSFKLEIDPEKGIMHYTDSNGQKDNDRYFKRNV